MKYIQQRQVMSFLQDLIKEHPMRLIKVLFFTFLIFNSCKKAATENKVWVLKRIQNSIVEKG